MELGALDAVRSREENNFADRMLAIMRNAFGGDAVKKA
jgi:6-phosphogluconate dehydrogenase